MTGAWATPPNVTAGGWPAPLDALAAAGPLAVGLAALAISPGVHVVLAAVLERRLVRVRGEFVAVIYGDALLALAAAVGVWLAPGGFSRSVLALFPGAAYVLAGGWVVFGLWQWRAEFRAGYYTRAQAVSPTKVWHQLGVYPLLGLLVGCVGVAGLLAPLPEGAPPWPGALGKATIIACLAGWSAALVYDRRHPKLGHPPYDWRRLRPVARPWRPDSLTLRFDRSLDRQG